MYNFDVSLHLSEREESVRTKRSLFTVVGPFYAVINNSDSSRGLAINETIIIRGDVEVLVPRESCNDLNHICTDVVPGTGATYQVSSTAPHFTCISAVGILNCIGGYIKVL